MVDSVQKTIYLGGVAPTAAVDLQRFMGTAYRAAISVPVTPVDAQVPAVTVPPTKHPA